MAAARRGGFVHALRQEAGCSDMAAMVDVLCR